MDEKLRRNGKRDVKHSSSDMHLNYGQKTGKLLTAHKYYTNAKHNLARFIDKKFSSRHLLTICAFQRNEDLN